MGALLKEGDLPAHYRTAADPRQRFVSPDGPATLTQARVQQLRTLATLRRDLQLGILDFDLVLIVKPAANYSREKRGSRQLPAAIRVLA